MITLDATSLIDSLSTETGTYTITRTVASSTYSGGVAVPGSTSTVTITAAVYQATGRDLQRLPEERRSIATVKIFTATRLYTGAQAGTGSEATYNADRITVDGVVHEVQTVAAWPAASEFYECLAQAIA